MPNVTKSTTPITQKEVKPQWHLIDMKGKTLGRVVNHIATLLQGKHKVTYVSYLDSGDYVVVVNAKDVVLTGKKLDTKVYHYYSGYPGGLRSVPARTLLEKNPEEIIRHAVAGMLPKNKQRDRRLTRLFIYSGGEHPYSDKISASKN